MQLVNVPHIFIVAVFLVFGLLLVAAFKGLRFPERCSAAGWSLFAGVAAFEAALLLGLESEIRYRSVVVFSVVGSLAFLIALFARDFSAKPTESVVASISKPAMAILWTLVVGIGLYFLATLDTCPENLFTWEGQVSRGFADSLNSGEGVVSFILKRFLWDEGLVSSGEKSLFYGSASRIIFAFCTFSVWSLRVAALFFALLSIPAFFMMTKKFFGPQTAFFASIILFLNPLVLSYARYGTSLSATIFSLILALYCTFLLLSQREPRWYTGFAAGLSYFLATLHYSPARLCVLLFIAFLFGSTFLHKREWTAAKLRALAAMAVFIVAVFCVQDWTGASSVFLNARGEQVFKLIEAPDWVDEQIGIRKSYDALLRADKIRLINKLVETNIGQFLGIMSPLRGVKEPWEGISAVGDPPELPLYFGPLLPFFIWGLLVHTFRLRSVKGYVLVLWICSVSGVLLLTNRVDLHRAYILVLPFSIFAAWGFSDFMNEYAKLVRARWLISAVSAIGLICLLALSIYTLRPDESGNVSQSIEYLRNAAVIDPRPVKVAFSGDHRYRSWINMALVEKNRMLRVFGNEGLDSAIVEGLSDEAFNELIAQTTLAGLTGAKHDPVLYLAPQSSFRQLGRVLEKQSCVLETRKFPDFNAVVVESCP